MRFAATKEIEYLSSRCGHGSEDTGLVEELSRRLEALRRYDQVFCHADWLPPRRHEGNVFGHDTPL
jgi:hypothetical protein